MPSTIGDRLKKLREKNRMTLEDVATYLNIGRPTVFKYETGAVAHIPSDKIEMLARLYSVSPAYIMCWSDDPEGQMESGQTDEAQTIAEAVNRLPKEKREQALNVFKVMFPDIFVR